MTQYATLEIDADFGGAVGEKTGVFELGPLGEDGAAQIEEGIRSGYLVDSALDDVVSTIERLLSDNGGTKGRAGIHVDAGGGQHYFQIDAETPGNARKPDGSPFQWGSSADPAAGPNEHTATDATPIQQKMTLINYMRAATTGSRTPARFRYGEIGPDGYLEDSLPVVFEDPSGVLESTRPATADLSMVLVETTDLSRPVQKELRRES
ncbi:hypothetical protein EFA46_015860 (plasmid) [Halarchaeum sp. CBA1220]|uniref:hypothetical protein n=1 Tax=Halarchaeum sp. CBA1220 TaxID=1853682 RepID=UPI0015A3E418|nr:hypothetical protein [Halarchaeum sp. CBA1220]QLC35733.1 hypothetical protein EFA46_015860 [Halarchaeum sp. CBA1220]